MVATLIFLTSVVGYVASAHYLVRGLELADRETISLGLAGMVVWTAALVVSA